MKPSIWTDAFVELQPEEALEGLAEVGWRYVELADKHWRDIDGRESAERDFKALRRLAERLSVRILQMHGPMFNICEDKNLRENVELAKRAIRWAGLLGVEWVVFHPGTLPFGEDESEIEEVRRRNVEGFRELCAEAEKHGVGIAVENTSDGNVPGRRAFGSTPTELAWLINELGYERVGVCWDTGHANLQRLDQYRSIKFLGRLLVATHIADNDGSGDQHLLPYEGNVKWDDVLRALREIGYKGLFNLEVGGAVHKIPLPIRKAKIRYAFELLDYMLGNRKG